MASDAERRSTMLDREKKRKLGYSVEQVDAFLEKTHALYEAPEPRLTQEDIQRVSFDLEKGGYVIDQVDAALSRLETAVVDKQTQWDIEHEGRVAWRGRTAQLAQTLYARADRPDKERFSKGEQGKASYDFRQVDRLVVRSIDAIRRELGDDGARANASEARKGDDVTSAMVSGAVFTRRNGSHGYDERSVDFYLNRVSQVLLRLESFDRIGDSVKDLAAAATSVVSPVPASSGEPLISASAAASFAQSAQPVQTAPIPQSQASSLAALVASGGDAAASSPSVPASAAGEPGAMPPAYQPSDDFNVLRKAEESIFRAAPDQAPAPVAPAALFPDSMTAVPAPAVAQDAPSVPIADHPDFGAAQSAFNPASSASASPSFAPAPSPAPAAVEPAAPAPSVPIADRPFASAQPVAQPPATVSVNDASAASDDDLPPSFPPSTPQGHVDAGDVRPVAHHRSLIDQDADVNTPAPADGHAFMFPTTPVIPVNVAPSAPAAAPVAALPQTAPAAPSVPSAEPAPVIVPPVVQTVSAGDEIPGQGRRVDATPAPAEPQPPADRRAAADDEAEAYIDRLMHSEFTTTDFEIPKLSFPKVDTDLDLGAGGLQDGKETKA